MVHDSTVGFSALAVSWLAISGGIWTLAERADRVLTPEARKATTDWLLSSTFEPFSGKWAQAFASVFDAIFGKRLLSWKGFLRSCAVSLFWCALLYVVWAVFHIHSVRIGFADLVKDEGWYAAMAGPLCVTGVVNFIPDYVSLLKSRRIILWMEKSDHVISSLGFMLLDVAITVLIGVVAFTATTCVVSKFVEPADPTPTLRLLADTVKYFFQRVVFLRYEAISGVPIPKGLWFYTTFMTSTWVILHVGAGLLSRAVRSVGSLSRAMTRLFDVRQQPCLSLAVMTIVLITAAYIPIGLFAVVF